MVTKATQAHTLVLDMVIRAEQAIGVAVTMAQVGEEQEQVGHQAMGLLMDLLD